MKAIDVVKLTKTYTESGRELTVLKDVSFGLAAGTSCAVVGPSGSGKTTLLGLCAGLDRPSSGTVEIQGQRLDRLDEDARAAIRNRAVGFVFQSFQLLSTLTALENVMVPAELQGRRGAKADALELLRRVGLPDRNDHYPAQLSGGEQQRVSLARAFINDPRILFADEPTGNLDAETSARVADLLFELNRERETTLVLVTHNMELAQRTERTLCLKGGLVVSDSATSIEAER